MAQAGRLVVRGDAGEVLGIDLRDPDLPARYAGVAGRGLRGQEMTDEHHAELAYLLKSARVRGTTTPPSTPATARPDPVLHRTSTMRAPADELPLRPGRLGLH